MSLVRGYYVAQGLNESTVNLLMTSWRGSTKAQYEVYLKEFCLFFQTKGVPFQPNLGHGINFLTELFHRGYSYNQIAMARSALSSLIDMNSPCGLTFGKHITVKRLMKGIFEENPTFPKYKMVWHVNKLFNLFRKLDSQESLSVAVLGKKLAILIAILAGGQRVQTVHKINVADIRVFNDKCIIPIYDKLKQSKPGKHMKPMEFSVYLREPKLCIVDNLKEYLKKTSPYRKHYELFLSYHKPHAPVSKDTLARWCKEMLSQAGININEHTSHSSRSAASSYLYAKGISLRDICDAAGWSSERTFVSFYKRH